MAARSTLTKIRRSQFQLSNPRWVKREIISCRRTPSTRHLNQWFLAAIWGCNTTTPNQSTLLSFPTYGDSCNAAGCRQTPAHCSSRTVLVSILVCPLFPKSWALTALTLARWGASHRTESPVRLWADISRIILLVFANHNILEVQWSSFR